jgi:hypothetical protein
VNVEPAAAAAVAANVTCVPCVNVAEQTLPQVMPAGELVTVPAPVPVFVTVNVCRSTAKVAVTVRS